MEHGLWSEFSYSSLCSVAVCQVAPDELIFGNVGQPPAPRIPDNRADIAAMVGDGVEQPCADETGGAGDDYGPLQLL